MITIDSIRVRLGGKLLLDGVTMHLTRGAAHGLFGIGGAGKTTLLNTLYGSVQPESGHITRNGHPLRRRDTAYLETDDCSFPGMTGRDYLDLVQHYRPSTDPEPLVRRYALPLDSQIVDWPADMRKKLALTAAAIQRKPLYLLDEPFDGLDDESVFTTRQLIARLTADGGTVIVCSRILSTLGPVCDDLYLLDGGRICGRWERGQFGLAAREIGARFGNGEDSKNNK